MFLSQVQTQVTVLFCDVGLLFVQKEVVAIISCGHLNFPYIHCCKWNHGFGWTLVVGTKHEPVNPTSIRFFFFSCDNKHVFFVLFERWLQHLSTNKDVLRASHSSNLHVNTPTFDFFSSPHIQTHPTESILHFPPWRHITQPVLFFSPTSVAVLFFPPSRLSFLSRMCFIAAIDAARARARPCTRSRGSCEPVRPRRRGRLTNSPHCAQTSLFPALPTCRASRCVVPLISQKNRRDDVWMERGSSSSILGGWKRALCIFQRTSPPGQSLS